MSQTRRVRRKTTLSKKEQQRLDEKKQKNSESLANKISKIAIMIVFFTMVVSLAYTVVLLSGN